MKWMLSLIVLLSAFSAHAEKKLEVIDLSPENPTAEQLERGREYERSQAAAAAVPPKEAKEFLIRLVGTVAQGLEIAQSGTMTGVQARNQAIALNKLQDEGRRFGVLFAPLHECNSASIDAALAWQQLIRGDVDKFKEAHSNYQEEAVACAKASS